MQSVLIVCGAGASSTFLASRMRSIAKSRGLAMTVVAASDAELHAHLRSTTVLLVGPHLEPRFPEFKAEAAAFGIPAALLPPTAFGPDGAEQAIRLVGDLVSLESAPAE
jgi:cellobiose PTS system EIIB component